ncbi:hypothetical protein [Quadrisphaera sp. INWT6]|uniref:hypothetical protein n=1 Tax=Quadrisphaera sp. INWT6 TaxID=2596917 RepID=UPI0018928204|nr:hypothetical protein [Quadrisphaera sp. INWT6]MBF5081385.1 hypothetical protein [Quadrisphaera sp. INWT6]
MIRTTSATALAMATLLALAGCTTAAAPTAAPVTSPAPAASPTTPTRGGEPVEAPSPTLDSSYPAVSIKPGSLAAKGRSLGLRLDYSVYVDPAGSWLPGEAAWQCEWSLANAPAEGVQRGEAARYVVYLATSRQSLHEESWEASQDAVSENTQACLAFLQSQVDLATADLS